VLRSGSSKEIIENLEKCGLNKQQVESILEHLMLIFTFLTRFKMNETDLDKLIEDQLNNESTELVRKTMCDFYEQYHNEIQSIITEQTYLNTNIVPKYQDFNWRLQVQLASRSSGMTKSIESDEVRVLLKFKLRKLNTDEFDYILLNCDLIQLAIFQQTLEQAIKDVKLKKSWINAAFD